MTDNAPRRHQLRRTKGYRKPDGVIMWSARPNIAVAAVNSVDRRTETVFTPVMTSTNFADTSNYSIEQVWGGPCDHRNCKGDCVAFITINFSDGWSVGGYFCRTHLNQYEVAYGLPLSTERRVAA